MKLKIKSFLIVFILSVLSACTNDSFDTMDKTLPTNNGEELMKDEAYLKGKFSVALANVFRKSEASRKFIREEALKQFDYDYDVLYMMVKDRTVEENKTFEELLLKFINKEELSALLQKIPNLTILVPSLPAEIFSAEQWNTKEEIPFIAYKDNNNEIVFTDSKGDIYTIGHDEVPNFPLVVVKPSDRVFLQTSPTRSINSSVLTTDNGTNFIFEYKEFDNINISKKVITRGSRVGDPEPTVITSDYPEILKKAYEAKKYAEENGIWQRDYLYYNISTKDGLGTFQKNISECIYAFELTGDPNNAYRLIADQYDDPHYSEYGIKEGSRVKSFWYDGNFEFIVKVYVSNTQLVSNEIIKAISISPDDLFELNIENKNHGRVQYVNGQRVVGIKSLKKYYLPTPLPLFDWNIEFYSSSIKISIEEKDNEVTQQEQIETTNTFANNFEFNLNFGEKVKNGAKFGASSSKTCKISTTITTHLDSEQLGDVIINFGDDIIIKDELEIFSKAYRKSNSSTVRHARPEYIYKTIYKPVLNPKYTSGYYKIEVMPLPQY